MIRRLFHCSLATQACIMGLIVGVVVWLVLDRLQSRNFREYAASELSVELGRGLRTARSSIDGYMNRFRSTTLLLSEDQRLTSYVKDLVGSVDNFETAIHLRLPQWLPPISRWRHVLPSHFLLVRPDGKLLELYTVHGKGLSKEAIDSLPQILSKSMDQVLLTDLAGVPRFITSSSVGVPAVPTEMRLVLIRDIDSDFMRLVYPFTSTDDLAVVFVTGNPSYVVASNTTQKIHEGNRLEDLTPYYLTAGKGFEDYGCAELELNLAVLIERQQARAFSDRLLAPERLMRATLAFILVLLLLALALGLIARVRRLTHRVRHFAEKQLGHRLESPAHGDELSILDESVSCLAEKVQSTLKSLQDSENKYRSIFENASEGIFQSTPDGTFLSANPRMAHILGYDSPAELIEGITNIKHQLYVNPKTRDLLFGLIREQGVVTGFEIQLYRKDRGAIWGSLNARPVYEENDKLLFIEGFLEDISNRKHAEAEKELLIVELQEALAKVKTLSGFLPICSTCKKIRDDKGYWKQIELYIRDHSDAVFSHGICPDCAKKLYPDFDLFGDK